MNEQEDTQAYQEQDLPPSGAEISTEEGEANQSGEESAAQALAASQPPPIHSHGGMDPRRRMRALLDIPDSQRSDAEWDELIELEISLAPGNRINPSQGGDYARAPQLGRRKEPNRYPAGVKGSQPRPHMPAPGPGGRPEASGSPKPGKRFFKKVKRPPGTGGSSGGGGSGPKPQA